MSHRRGTFNEGPHTISTLLSGSVADEHSPSVNRVSYTGSIGSYDPFCSVPHARCSPPKTIMLESPVVNSHTHFQDTVPDRSSAAYYSPYATSYNADKSDSIGHEPNEILQAMRAVNFEASTRRMSQDYLDAYPGSLPSSAYVTSKTENRSQQTEVGTVSANYQTRRRPLTQDEFDGPSQLLPLPMAQEDQVRSQILPELPIHLDIVEQDEIMRRYNDALSTSAFHFVAKYQFPIPLEREKPPVRSASDRDWTEWAYLLKRLATKRRIPARVLHDNQIKSLVTILENSIAVRNCKPREQHHPEKIMKDDRYILQLVSAGIQVARILMDSLAMQQLIDLYVDVEAIILNRRQHNHGMKLKR